MSAERADELEARYMQIVSTYANRDDVRAYPELLALSQLTVAAGDVDFLGSVASPLELLNDARGQVFTPFPLARMMAAMTLGDAKALIERDGYITLCEPASGAGVMVLAAADVLEA